MTSSKKMSCDEVETIDPSNINSIKDFSAKLKRFDKTKLNNEFLLCNIQKCVHKLLQLNEDQYNEDKTYQLLNIVNRLVFYLKGQETENWFNEIINSGFYEIISKIIDYNLKIERFEKSIVRICLLSLNNFLFVFEEAAELNVKFGIINKLKLLIDKENLLDKKVINDTLDFYDGIFDFLNSNADTNIFEVKQNIKEIFTTKIILNELEKVESLIVTHPALILAKMNLMFILFSNLNEDEIDKLNVSDDIISILMRLLNEIISKGKTNKDIINNTTYYTVYSINQKKKFYDAEILIGTYLLKLSVNESIKQKLFDLDIIDLLVVLLKNGNEEEIKYSCELICSLAFNKNVKKYLKKTPEIINLIETLFNKRGNFQYKRSCYQILELITEKTNMTDKFDTDSDNVQTIPNHIMISYNHKYKEKCLKICKKLEKKGYKCWIDINESFNDLYDTMAKAIENASIVLICYSQEYKDSMNCRFEANYAARCKKEMVFVRMQKKYNPDGWLGMMVSAKLYIDFADTDDTDKYKLLFNQIDSILNQPELNKNFSSKPGELKSSTLSSVENWSSKEVEEWLVSNNLEIFSKLMKEYTGRTLKSMWEMKKKNYKTFLKYFEKEIEISKIDIRFKDMMDYFQFLDTLFDPEID